MAEPRLIQTLNPPRSRSVASFAADAASDAEVALGAARIAMQAADKLPIPDPRDSVSEKRLAGLEQSMWARISPRRNRWPELAAIDERVVGFDRRQDELSATLFELRQRRERADAAYSDALAQWIAAGQQEPKPVSEANALDEAITEASGEHAAQDSLRDRVLEERIAFVEKHRKRLVKDAERETEQAKERYLAHVAGLEQAREELVGLRETAVWASLYPSETLASMAPSHALVGGRLRETEQHLPGMRGALPAHAVLALLRADAEFFATVSTVEQAAAMQGVSRAELKGDEAMWSGSDADLARQKREKQRVIEDYARVWGRPPPEFQ